jgi:hypothetical protein
MGEERYALHVYHVPRYVVVWFREHPLQCTIIAESHDVPSDLLRLYREYALKARGER